MYTAKTILQVRKAFDFLYSGYQRK